MKLSKRQLRKLIESFIVDDEGNLVPADDAYDSALDTAADAMDAYRASKGKSPIGKSYTRSSNPEDVQQGLELADAIDADYSDFERTSLDMPEEDRKPDKPMSRLDAKMKAKYGQGMGLGEVYSLVVEDNAGKEVLIPIIDDHSEEEKKRGEGIPEDTMFSILDAYRNLKKSNKVLKYFDKSLVWDRSKLAVAEGRLEEQLAFLYRGLLEDHVYELLIYPPYNYSYEDAQTFPLLRVEPRHKELENALSHASGLM